MPAAQLEKRKVINKNQKALDEKREKRKQEVIDMLFSVIDKPDNIHKIDVHIYKGWGPPQRARINIWRSHCERNNDLINPLTTVTLIDFSYFVHIGKEKLIIKK